MAIFILKEEIVWIVLDNPICKISTMLQKRLLKFQKLAIICGRGIRCSILPSLTMLLIATM